MSCCDGCGDLPAGWSEAELTACVRATQAVRPTTVISPAGGPKIVAEQAAPGEWIVRIPGLNMTIVLPDEKFRAAFQIKDKSHAG